MDIKNTANTIMTLVGGDENVAVLTHCATRLRFKLKNQDLANIDELKKITGIVGVRKTDGGIQVIIGQDVDDVYDEIMSTHTFTSNKDNVVKQTENSSQKKQNWFFRLMSTIADCLVPMLPALIAAGLTSALINLGTSFGILSSNSMNYKVLHLIANAPLYFIPFMVVYGASKKFEVNPIISYAVIAILMDPDFSKLAVKGASYAYLFGLPIRMFEYSSTILPALLLVYCQKYVQKYVRKFTPKCIAVFMEPLVTFLILAILMMVVLGPIGAYIGDGLGTLMINGSQNYKWLICLILGGFGNFLVGTGMHYCMIPAVITIFTKLGYDNFYGGACMAGAFALAGATLGLFFKTKKSGIKQVAGSTGVTALIGIAEPALYGVFFKYKSVMIADMIAGTISGFLAGFLGINSYAMAPAGVTSIPVFAGKTFINLIIVISVAFILGFVLSFIMYHDEEVSTDVE